MIEIRGHARGGQGMVTAFDILAKIFSKLGDYQVQSFPAFGVERTGAPIQAFLRIAKGEILNRSNVYHPHLVVVFDETLIDLVPVFDGLRKGGTVLLNTEKSINHFKKNADSIFTVPATKISIEKGLGSKSLPIVNASMIGAIMRLIDGDMEIAQKVISENVPAKPKANSEASVLAFENVVGFGESELRTKEFLDAHSAEKIDYNIEELFRKQKDKTEYKNPIWSQPMSLNKTGNWRVLTPEYDKKTAPCSSNCPAGTDVREFIKLAGEGKFHEAVEIIYEHNPFPAVCGRVCPHFCEQACNRSDFDESVNIGGIERFLGDKFSPEKPIAKPITKLQKIAVIGGGPAGLTAALRLRENGYNVTVFEALEKAGGMMRTGIPSFRLPNNALDSEIKRIEDAGVEILLNNKTKISEIEKDFDAIIVSVGSHIGSKMNIENEKFVVDGIKFLYDFKIKNDRNNVNKDDKVAIIGGGNTAIDVARTSLRLGAIPTIYYRRTENEMPAIAHEVEEALAEGIKIEFLTTPTGLQKNDDLLNLKMIKMELGEPDESGRRKPIVVDGSDYQLQVNHVIAAIGQKSDMFVFDNQQIKAKQGKIEFSSSKPIFSAGDMAWGGTVTEAIGSGNKVAAEVHAFLQKIPYQQETSVPNVVVPVDLNFTYYLKTPRIHNQITHKTDFTENFDEVVQGLSDEQILAEGSRCLHCGDCFSCGNCFNYCPDAAIHVDDNGRLRIDYDYCKGCGICVQECPCSAMTFEMKEAENE